MIEKIVINNSVKVRVYILNTDKDWGLFYSYYNLNHILCRSSVFVQNTEVGTMMKEALEEIYNRLLKGVDVEKEFAGWTETPYYSGVVLFDEHKEISAVYTIGEVR